MEEFIDEKLAMTLPALERYRVDRVIGTSATAAAVVCAVRGIPRASRDEADRQKATIAEVRRFYELAASVNLAARRELAGIGPRRAEIVVAGTGALLRVLESLDVPELYYSAAGLRDGLIADLASRSFGRNVPTLDPHQRRTIELLARKYEVGIRHARHVAMLAGEMFQQLRTLHGLDAMDGRLLEAAAYLLDAGHFVSDSAHHKHSYYVVANSDLEGFTNQERAILALLCRYHRKSMPKASHDAFQRLTAGERGRLMKLIPLIRAADALEESQEQAVEGVGIRIKASSVQVLVESSRTVDLEMWALERTSAVFEQVYGRMLEVGRA
jgi:exopolyphosphatase/guanosine-5'-triphosphate,3'-diphosphate pyrophosphatase